MIRNMKRHQKFFLNYAVFVKNFSKDISPFCGATDTPVLDFLRRLPWFQSQGGFTRLHPSSPVRNGILGFTCGATPADLLVASMFKFDTVLLFLVIHRRPWFLYINL